MERERANTELVIGLVAPIGADRDCAYEALKDALRPYGYDCDRIKVSELIEEASSQPVPTDTADRLVHLMDEGNRLRKNHQSLILGAWVAAEIRARRANGPPGRHAYVVDSLKHPKEVAALREAYPGGFYLIALNVYPERRESYLCDKGLSQERAQEVLARDESEAVGHGQKTSEAFQLADFFLTYKGDPDKVKNSVKRIVRLLFGDPYVMPTFNEFAMYMAFASGMRSGDLSRQVGAVIARDRRILATGANEVPAFGGGSYWPEYSRDAQDIFERSRGRDFTRGADANHEIKGEILDDMVAALDGDEGARAKLRESKFWDIGEFGRAVHAEMEALLSCARSSSSALGADLYSTTFPCHNCAKHLVGAGIRRVVFVEPYPKSRALALHDDSMALSEGPSEARVKLEPFVGVGPRQFVNMFSVSLGAGEPLGRKGPEGEVLQHSPAEEDLRSPMLPLSYLEREERLAILAAQMLKEEGSPDGNSPPS